MSKNAELHEQIQMESKRSADRIQDLENQFAKAIQKTLPKNVKDLEGKIEALPLKVGHDLVVLSWLLIQCCY